MALLLQQNLTTAVSVLLIFEMILLFSIVLIKYEHKNDEIECSISYHLLSIFFLIYGAVSFDNYFLTSSLIVLLAGLLTRALFLTNSLLLGILPILGFRQKLAVFSSSFFYGIFVYFILINLLPELAKIAIYSSYFILILTIYILSVIPKRNTPKISVPIFRFVKMVLLKTSQWSHRIIGPIVTEWLALRVSTGFIIMFRLLCRFVSYASIQRTMATSLALAIIIILYFAELEWIG